MSGQEKTVVLDPLRFPELDLLRPPLQLRLNRKQTAEVADILRKKWLLLTPEEWVRQHVLFWLLNQSAYPAELLSVERAIQQSRNRTDVLGFNRHGQALLLVECKEPSVKLDESVMMQAMRYNQSLLAKFIWLSNGKAHQVLELDHRGIFIRRHQVLPDFETMIRA